MLRLGRALLIFIVGIFTGVALRWHYIRLSRKLAPHPDTLLRNPDFELQLRRNHDTLKIEWQHKSTEAKIYLGLSPDSINPEPASIVKAIQSTIITDIDHSKRYFVEVHFADGLYLKGAERFLPLDSFPNFRDIGGYKTEDDHQVRWNRVFRGGSMDNLSDDDLERLDELHIQLVCDVRSTEEMLNHPDRLPKNVTLLSAPPQSDDNPWIQLARILLQRNYLETAVFKLYSYVLIDNNPQMFSTIFQRLAHESNLPMIIHCAAGKDRSGTIIAVLLKLLGVPDETIIADYSLSNLSYAHSRKAAQRVFESLKIFGLREEDLAYLLIADAKVMAQTLAYLDQHYGSAEAYLCDYVGLSQETIQTIRKNLLE